MTRADRVHSTPRHRSSRSTENLPTATAAADPVVALSKQLLTIWDALDASEVEFRGREKDTDLKAKSEYAARLLGEWQVSVEMQIGFTQATSAAGALVRSRARSTNWTHSSVNSITRSRPRSSGTRIILLGSSALR